MTLEDLSKHSPPPSQFSSHPPPPTNQPGAQKTKATNRTNQSSHFSLDKSTFFAKKKKNNNATNHPSCQLCSPEIFSFLQFPSSPQESLSLLWWGISADPPTLTKGLFLPGPPIFATNFFLFFFFFRPHFSFSIFFSNFSSNGSFFFPLKRRHLEDTIL